MRKNHAKQWFMVGTMVGALGAGIGMGLNNGNSGRKFRKVKRNAAHMAVKMSRDAGNAIGSMGDALASKLR